MKLKFDVTAKEYGILRDILTDMLPPDSRVWVFGSRAKNTVRFNSDIDLALEPAKGKPLPKDTIARLKDAFNEAPLPYRVDVLDINHVSENFQTIIRQQAIAFPLAKSDKVPKLRFPEFSGEWNKNLLGKLFPKIRNGFVGTATPYYQEVGIKYLQGKNIKNENIDPKGMINVAVEFHEWQKKSQLKSGDILMVQSGHVGECAVVTDEYYGANCHALVVMSPIESVSSTFVRNLFYASTGMRLINKIKTGNTIAHILTSDLKQLAIDVPSTLPEQQKIAAFLSAIDTKIEQLTQKKALLEQYKRGVMQKLFSQELRFKDAQGKAFPDWEEKRLGDVYKFKSTNSLSRDKLNYEGGGVRNIHYGDIHTQFKPAFDLRQEQVPFVNSSVDLSRISEDKYCQHGDLVIADASEDYGDIGKTIELISLNNEKVLAGLHTLLARLTSKGINIGFGNFLMACASVRKQIKIIAQGTKVLGISAGRMAKIKLLMPCPEEQQKIADFLSAIDRKIDLVTTELTQVKTFKKGLLQQMFI